MNQLIVIIKHILGNIHYPLCLTERGRTDCGYQRHPAFADLTGGASERSGGPALAKGSPSWVPPPARCHTSHVDGLNPLVLILPHPAPLWSPRNFSWN